MKGVRGVLYNGQWGKTVADVNERTTTGTPGNSSSSCWPFSVYSPSYSTIVYITRASAVLFARLRHVCGPWPEPEKVTVCYTPGDRGLLGYSGSFPVRRTAVEPTVSPREGQFVVEGPTYIMW